MCGINGIWKLQADPGAASRVEKMNTTLSHRGPDAGGVYSDGSINLGHRRLSIIDLSDSGKQPMTSSDGRYVLTYNGEFYNYLEVKAQLTDYPFQSGTDTEVLLAAFAKWGKDCLTKINGMFAFAIWDKQEKKLVIARDRIGIKPLYYYYHESEQMVVFSSEMRALLSSDLVPKKLNQAALADYLRYQTVHAPDTIIENVHTLLPGHVMEIDGGAIKIEKYWEFEVPSKQGPVVGDYASVCKEVRQLLFEAVEKRLVADVPFGAFLSGGIDSSAIVAIMSQVASQQVKTFSVVFEEEQFNEGPFSELIAKKYKTDHTPILLSVNSFKEELPNALAAMDHPSGDGPNTFVVSKVTREAGVTMALSGLGGDELFAGYDVFKRMAKIQQQQWINAIPRSLRALGGSVLKAARPGIFSNKIAELLAMPTVDFAHAYPISRQLFSDQMIQSLLTEKKLANNVVGALCASLEKEAPILSQVSVAEMSSYMQSVLLRDSDQMSMAHALEVRVPFLDHALIEYVLRVPDQHKFPHSPKRLMTDALAGLVPDAVINRPKMGFTFPWAQWMKQDLKDFCEERINSLAERSYFESDATRKLFQDFLNNDPSVSWSRVWPLVVLEDWLQRHGIV